MKVRLTDEAKTKLQAIFTHIELDSPVRAEAMVQRILRRAGRIGHVPRAGRKLPKYQLDTLREVFERPYWIIYRIKPDMIEVVTVMHYRQLLPEDLI